MSSKRKYRSGQEHELTPQRKTKPVAKTPPIPTAMDARLDKQDKILEDICKQLALLKSLPSIENKIEDLTTALKDHQTSLTYTQEEVDELKQRVKSGEERIDKLEEEMREARAETKQDRITIERLQEEVLDLEAYSRRENLLLMNISEEKNEDCRAKVNRIFVDMGLKYEIKLSRVHRLGKYKEDTVRPIIVRFHYAPDRERVWKSRSKLSNTRIIIREDYPLKIEQNRQVLLPIASHARNMKKNVNIVNDKLFVEGRKYTAQTLDSLPEELQPQNLCEKKITHEDTDYLLFAGKYSPLSNWHAANFEVGGTQYNSMEQYYVQHKALFASEKEKAEAVMKMSDPVKMKKMSHKIKVN